MTRLAISSALFLFLAPLAANVSGVWALNFVDKDGTHTQGYCTFKQDGQKLTGTCGAEVSNGLPLTGVIDGHELSWQVEGGPDFHAVVDQPGTFMKGTFSRNSEGIFTGMKTK